jgi:hypothetical protein
LLREDFGAQRVLVFGSLAEAEGAYFDARSDIDIAAWGIASDDYFLAVARLLRATGEFGADLVRMEACPDYLLHAIEVHGVEP